MVNFVDPTFARGTIDGIVKLLINALISRMYVRVLCMSFVALCLAQGAVIIDKGTPQLPSYNMTGFENADDFSFASSNTILAVRFWLEGSLPSQPIYYRIYDNGASGAPGNLLASGNAIVSTTPMVSPSGFIADFNLASSVTLGPGTYYLSLHDGPYGTSNGAGLFWFSSGPGSHFQQANGIATPPAEPQTSNE